MITTLYILWLLFVLMLCLRDVANAAIEVEREEAQR